MSDEAALLDEVSVTEARQMRQHYDMTTFVQATAAPWMYACV